MTAAIYNGDMGKKRLSTIDLHIFTARVPEELWQELVRSADQAGRTYNAELVEILRKWFAEHPVAEKPRKQRRGK